MTKLYFPRISVESLKLASLFEKDFSLLKKLNYPKKKEFWKLKNEFSKKTSES